MAAENGSAAPPDPSDVEKAPLASAEAPAATNGATVTDVTSSAAQTDAPAKRRPLWKLPFSKQVTSEDGKPDKEEEEKKKKEKTKSVPIWKLFSSADALDLLLMILGTIGAVGLGIAMPALSLLFGQLTNSFGQNTGDPSQLVHAVSTVSLRFLYVACGAALAAYLEVACWMLTGERQASRLRSKYLGCILRQDISYFDKDTGTGEVIGHMSGDILTMQEAMGEKIGQLIRFTCTFIGGFAVAFATGWQLTLVMLATLPLLVAAGATMGNIVTRAASKGQEAYADAGNVVEESIGAIRTVLAFTGEARAAEQYNARLDKSFQAGVKQSVATGLGIGLTMMVMYCSYSLALWYGSRLVLSGSGYTGGTVMTVLFGVLIGGMSLGQAGPSITTLVQGQAAAYQVFQIIERVPIIDSSDPSGETPSEVKGNLEMRSVAFSYPTRPDFPIFSDFSLSIPAGKSVALVGESGSGKSTVISLVERFYDPLSGSVLLDGRDLRSLQLKWLRQQIALVSQEPVLFHTSIRRNISYGRDGEVPEEDMVRACQMANIHDFILSLPQGYNTEVGERGTQLSGGQKQRIAIARALIRNPRVLLLDEATSALDAESEKVVQGALDSIMGGRTTVIVAHRLSTVRKANTIAVMQRGKVVETGRHDELISRPNGAYYQLVHLQESHFRGSASNLLELGSNASASPAPTPGSVTPPPAALLGSAGGGAGEGVVVPGEEPAAVGLALAATEAAGLPGLMGPAVGDQSALGAAAGTGAGTETTLAVPGHDLGAGSRRVALSKSDRFIGAKTFLRRKSTKKNGQGGKPEEPEEDDDSEDGGEEGNEGEKGEKGSSKKKKTKDVSVMRLVPLNQPEWPYFIIACFGSIGNGLIFPVFSILLSHIIATFYNPVPGQLEKDADFWALMFIVLAASAFLLLLAQNTFYGLIGSHLIRRVRRKCFQAVLRQEVAWFDKPKNSSGAIGARLSTDAAQVRAMVGDRLALVVQNLSTLVAGLVIAFTACWQLALVVLSTVPLLVIAGGMQMRALKGFSENAKTMYEEASRVANDAVGNIRTVAAFGAEAKVMALYEEKCALPLQAGVRKAQVSGLGMAFSQFVMFANYSLAFWYGGQLVQQGVTTFQNVFQVFFAIVMSAMGVAQTASMVPDFVTVQTAVNSIFRILDRQSKIDPDAPGETPPPEGLRGEVELLNVHFHYPLRPDITIFRGLSLVIPPGQTVALVGQSGSGKSTVVSLVERFYDPQDGQVLLDGLDVRTLQVKWLRQQLALVNQEPTLFNVSIRDNIAYGRESASESEIIEAAKAANAHTFVSALPQGYDTMVGERGVQLSGGQKQRVAIARAVLKNPRVLLLDEATSALDAESEAVVQEALERVMVGRTTIVIAHRLATVVNANKIAVMQAGHVVEEGTHMELVNLGGAYASLVSLQ